MCCAIDGLEHQNPLFEDGSCMHCGKVPGPEDTLGPVPIPPTLEQIQDMIKDKGIEL